MAVLTTSLALNQNEITSSLFNQIISQQVFSKNISGLRSLVERLRVDGTLYGDTKLYVSTDILEVYDFSQKGNSSLLTVTEPPAPKLEKIVIDQFKQIAVTVYPYLQKRAFADEGTYAQFIAVVLAWLGDTKRVYETTLVNAYVGTVKTNSTINKVEVEMPKKDQTAVNLEESANRLRAMAIGKALADLEVAMGDPSRSYNELGFMRAYDLSDFIFVWNSAYSNEIRAVDLPTIFHKDSVVAASADQFVLPSHYFGNVSSATTTTANHRALRPMKVSGVFYQAGQLIASGKTVTANSTYIADAKIIGKLVHKEAIPFMSAFSVGTSFYDQQKLRENHWLTFGHNTLDYIRNFPIITIEETNPAQ